MVHDPFEMQDVAAQKPEIVAKLKAAYDAWFDDVTSGRDYSVPSRIFLGAPQENPSLLTRQDWRGPRASWSPDGIGYWEVKVVTRARYDITLQFNQAKASGEARLTCGNLSVRQPIKAGDQECVFRNVPLLLSPGRLQPTLKEAQNVLGVNYVEVRRLD